MGSLEEPSSCASFSGAPLSDFCLGLTRQHGSTLTLSPSPAEGLVGPLDGQGLPQPWGVVLPSHCRLCPGRGGRRGWPAAVVPPAVTCAQRGVGGLGRCFSKHSPGTSRISTAGEPVRPASRPHPRPSLIRSSRGGAGELLSQALQGILMRLKSRLGCHWSRLRHLREHISKSTFG